MKNYNSSISYKGYFFSRKYQNVQDIHFNYYKRILYKSKMKQTKRDTVPT